MVYTYIPYPKWIYHMDGRSIIVQDEAQHKAMGDGWFDSPDKAQAALKRLAQSAALADLQPYSFNHQLIDAVYKLRYGTAKGPEQWGIIREYMENFPAPALESTWAAQPISLIPHIESWRQSLPATETPAAVADTSRDGSTGTAIRHLQDAESKTKQKPGPKPNMDYHRDVAAIVKLYGEGWREESNLAKIAKELDRDKEGTPPRKKWATRQPRARSWERAVGNYPESVRKTIAYSLRMAARDISD